MIICELCSKQHTGQYGSGRFCSQSCASSFSTKNKRKEINKKVSDALRGRSECGWNKGTGEMIVAICEVCGKKRRIRKIKYRKTCSDDCYKKLLKKKSGGYRKGSGRGKQGYYKDIWCDSSYELIFVAYHLENKIKIKRCKKKFPYIYKGKEHTFHPDFEIDDIIYEIKGYHTPLTEIKIESIRSKGYDIKLLFYNDLKHMESFLKRKFNFKNILELYNSPPTYDHICKQCNKKFKGFNKNSIFCSRICSGKFNSKFAKMQKTFNYLERIRKRMVSPPSSASTS